jgi:septum formation inhibitor-activating ATPase MinD
MTGEIPIDQVEEALRMKVHARIPDESKLILRSINNGEPVALTAASCKYSRKVVELADDIRKQANLGKSKS